MRSDEMYGFCFVSCLDYNQILCFHRSFSCLIFIDGVCVRVCVFPFKLHTLQYDAASHTQYKNWLSFSLHDTESSFIFHCKFFFLSFLINTDWDGMDFHIRYDHCDRKMYQYWLRYKWTERYHKIKIVT